MVQNCGEQDLYNTFLQPYRCLSKGLFLITESCIDIYTLYILHRTNNMLYPLDHNQHPVRKIRVLDSDNYSKGRPILFVYKSSCPPSPPTRPKMRKGMKFIKPKIFIRKHVNQIIEWINILQPMIKNICVQQQ